MDSAGSSMLFGAAMFLASALLRAVFTVCETALTEIPDVKVRAFENSGSKKEKNLYRLLRKPLRLITAFSSLRIFTAVLSAYAAFVYFYPPLCYFVAHGGVVTSGIKAVCAFITVFLLSAFLTVFTDGIPRRVTALGKNGAAEKTAGRCSGFIRAVVTILTPLTAISEKLITGISSMFGIDSSAEKELVTEENILMMVDAGNESGVLEEAQKEMINNIFEFGDLPVSDVMTHRTEMSAVSEDSGISELVYLAINTGFSRIPVYKDSIDHIIGIICVKDLLCLVGNDSVESISVKDFVRDTIFFPETGMCSDLFKKMTAEKTQLAVVVDEYGGTAGIVSLEDLVESIVGNIQDEYDNETEDIIKISEGEYTVSGTANPRPIMEKLGCALPEDTDFDTMSSLFISLLGFIPEDGTMPSVIFDRVKLTALVTEDMCVTRIKAELISESEGADNSERSDTDEQKKN